jgi:hypothetical protein
VFRGTVKVAAGTDKTVKMLQSLEQLVNLDVLVGIPEETAERGKEGGEKDESGGITNAQLAYIHTHGVRSASMRAEMQEEINKGVSYGKAYEMYVHEHGSPLWHVPPRPIIEPAIEDPENQKIIAEDLKKAAQAALDGNFRDAEAELNKAGMDAQNAVRDWFTNPNNNWPPNAPATVERKGSDRPLIDTGELRKSITYVIRKKA